MRQRSGGAEGIRTLDLLDAIEARSQLRHGPTLQEISVSFIALRAEAVKRAALAPIQG
jgi:hypothetical protein